MRHRTLDSTTNVIVETKSSVEEFNAAHVKVYGVQNSGRGLYASKIQKSDLYDQRGRSKDRDGIPISKICSHTVTEVVLDGTNTIGMHAHVVGDDFTLAASGSPGYIASVVGGLPTSFIIGHSIQGGLGVPASIDWDSLKAAFYASCDEYIPTELLIGEDIAENETFVEAFKIALNPSRAVRTFVKTLRPLMRKFVRPSMKDAHDVAKAAGNGFLSYNFGVKPAIKDLVSVLNAHQVVRARLNYLKNNRGSFVPIRVKQRKSASNTPGVYGGAFMSCYSDWGSNLTTRLAVMSGWGRVRHDLNNQSTWTAYAQYFGVQHIVGLAWELIPFSFVVDWVTNAQERIRNLTRLRLGGPYSELRSFCCTEKLVQPFDLLISPGAWSSAPDWSGDHSTSLKVGQGKVSVFNRSLVPPEGTTTVDFDGWGLFQTLASGSLIIQRT